LDGGAEAMLQLRAAYLSEDDRASAYWSHPGPYAARCATGNNLLTAMEGAQKPIEQILRDLITTDLPLPQSNRLR
jgi:hypothetical protein